jgi:exopolysaccharide production protein ExoZ
MTKFLSPRVQEHSSPRTAAKTIAPVPPRPREKFGGIQAGRAVAAILVIFAHSGTIIAEPRFFGVEPFGGVLRPWGVGVDFFFVLSGFIIAWVHWDDIGRKNRLRAYALNRFLRIYPPYWGILLPLSLLYFIFPGTGQPSQHDPVNFVFSVLLAPYPDPPVLGVAWTLVHEIIFYVVFGVLIQFGRRVLWLLPTWAVSIISLQLSFDRLPFPLNILFNEFNLEFLLGVAAALWLRRHRTPFPNIVTAIGCLFFLGTMLLGRIIYDHSLAARSIFGLSSVAFIVGSVELERSGRLRIPTFALVLGAASYAIYLIHGIALSATIQVVRKILGPTLPMIPLVLFLVSAGVIAGVVYHVVVEEPLTRSLRRWLASTHDSSA